MSPEIKLLRKMRITGPGFKLPVSRQVSSQ